MRLVYGWLVGQSSQTAVIVYGLVALQHFNLRVVIIDHIQAAKCLRLLDVFPK